MSSSENYGQQRIAYARKVSPYVIKILDEFGKQKWGMAGCLFKGRTYKIYTKEHDTGYLPEWMIVHNIGKLSKKYSKLQKYPYYKIVLDVNDKVLSGLNNPCFVIYYGGYDTEDIWTGTIVAEVSEATLKQGLDGILNQGYDPSPIYSGDLDPKERGSQGIKRVI
ncbi:MAG: hypothetical protein EHM12_11515 [Dehalococcoidia bacterium]|nr:MAG: hypothetical protein EHM12_11515 [Dehalococcoidia bacterium]